MDNQYKSDVIEIIQGCYQYLSDYKRHFAVWFYKAPSTDFIKYDQRFINSVANQESEYWKIITYWRDLLVYYYDQGILPIYFYNRILSLIFLMPDIVSWMSKKKYYYAESSLGGNNFNRSIKEGAPESYYPWLAVILVIEYAEARVKLLNNEKEKDKLQAQIDALKSLYVKATDEISSLFKPKIDITKMLDFKGKIKDVDVFFSQDKINSIEFTDCGIAKSIVILGNRGCGKTVGLLRVGYSALKQGYTVLCFGQDKRKEFLWSSNNLTQRTNQSYYNEFKKQGEDSVGLPLTVYTANPIYEIEHDIKAFLDKPTWNELTGWVSFDIDVNTTSKLIDSFRNWRNTDRRKKVVLLLNEAQNFADWILDKDSFDSKIEAWKFINDVRGYMIPLIINTQELSKIEKGLRQQDELFCSYIDSADARKKIAKNQGLSELSPLINDYSLKQNHEFIHVKDHKINRVRFLIPPCMVENAYYNMDDLIKKK